MVENYQTLRAALEWQLELGVCDVICEHPLNRFEAHIETNQKSAQRRFMPPSQAAPISKPVSTPSPDPVAEAEAAANAAPIPKPVSTPSPDPVAEAEAAANVAQNLEDLADSQAAYTHCPLKQGAQNFVFSDGQPDARVMIIGEAPGRNEDLQGKPFVGQAGLLLDRMFAAIGMGRNSSESPLYISNIIPWRPPQNRPPEASEIAMMLPFIKRHIALADPEILVLMGGTSCAALLGRKGITKLRGIWTETLGKPVLPMLHPAYLLRNPAAKALSWRDLLALQARLREKS